MVQEWFVVRDDLEIGPFALTALQDRVAKGFLTVDTLIRHVNAKAPVKAGTIKELFAEAGTERSVPSTQPVPPPLPTSAERAVSSPSSVPPLPSKAHDRTPAGSTTRAAKPLSLDDDSEPTEAPLADIARWHRWLIRAAAIYLLVMIADLLGARLLVWIGLALILLTWPPVCYALARALGRPPIPYALLAAVPLVNFIVFIDLGGRATRALRAAGIRAGLLGARVGADAIPASRRAQGRRGESIPESDAPEEPGTPKSGWITRVKSVGKAILLGCFVIAPGIVKNDADRNLPPAAAPNTAQPAAGGAEFTERLAPKPEFREGDVVWTDNGLADEAKKLGQALRETGYSRGEGKKRVDLARMGDTRVVTVYLKPSEINQPWAQAMVKDYLGVLWAAIAFEGLPLTLALCDDNKADRITYPVEPSSRHKVGPQCDVYHTSSLRAEAERFGQLLVRTGEANHPGKWTLTRHGDKWLVCPGGNTGPATDEVRAALRQTVRQISDEVFGGQLVELSFFTKQGVERVTAGR